MLMKQLACQPQLNQMPSMKGCQGLSGYLTPWLQGSMLCTSHRVSQRHVFLLKHWIPPQNQVPQAGLQDFVSG